MMRYVDEWGLTWYVCDDGTLILAYDNWPHSDSEFLKAMRIEDYDTEALDDSDR